MLSTGVETIKATTNGFLVSGPDDFQIRMQAVIANMTLVIKSIKHLLFPDLLHFYF